MKLQLSATSAAPAAFAAGSVALALLLLPSGGGSVHSSGMAPALGLMAGDVAAAVEVPVRAITKARSTSSPVRASTPTHERAPQSSAPARQSPAPSGTRSGPARRAVGHGRSHPRVVAPTPVQAAGAPTPKVIVRPVKHNPGKAKALGHLRKAKAKATGHNRKLAPPASGRPADAPHGPPAVPPGRAKAGKAVSDLAGGSGRGGGR